MGAYSATAPYNCPKSAKILTEGLAYIMGTNALGQTVTPESSGRYSFGVLSLLAANNPSDPGNAARMARAQTEARALIPSAATRTQLMADERDSASQITWQRGHTLIVLAEYYLATGDAQVLPAIEAYAVNIARNQSMFGTLGHIYAEKNPDGSDNGPMGGVYGPVNSTGMPCFLGLLLARECGLNHPGFQPSTAPRVEAAIERTSRFFAYYAGRGAVPYGEHEAYWQGHESNGKSGLAALCFALQDNRSAAERFFAKMAAAAASERGEGHTGAFANYLWAPLGAATGGEETAASHFSRISWMLDLNRRWDGGFDYDCLSGEGSNSGAQWYDFRMSTPALLAYALPLRKLHITGRGDDPARHLTSTDVAEAAAVDGYVATSRSTGELVADLGNWSPLVQRRAAEQLATRSIDTTLLAQITTLATDPNSTSRVGACYALGRITTSTTANARAATLAGLLADSDNKVRFMAAEAMRYLPDSARLSQLNAILSAAASTAKPLMPFDGEDPLHFAHGRLAMLLFYSGNAYGPKGVIWGSKINSPTVINRSLLYPAIRAVAANPVGQARSTLAETYKNLTAADVNALADTMVDSIQFRAPADKMFSAGLRDGGLIALEKYNIAEGVPASMVYMIEDGRADAYTSALGILKNYAGTCTTVVPDPDVIGFCKALLSGSQATAAQAVLDAIAADTNPVVATPFKSIQSMVADAPSLNLPSRWTTLRVSATDLAKGDSIYTWRKVHGPGAVSFTPNGTAASKNTIVFFDGTPGEYLFEVKMSDSRGFTEVYSTVSVNLRNPDGTLPSNNPPVANPQSLAIGQSTPTPVTLSGSDPEGYPLLFAVTGQPAHGTLTGTPPYLVYTSDFNYTGSDAFTFKVTDSNGHVSSATIGITVAPISGIGLAIYEPFIYPAGGLAGKGGSTEVGLSGTWAASTSAKVVAGSLAYGILPTAGGSIGNLNGGSNNYGGTRAVSASALAANGLLNDGATLWFSVVMGYGTNYAVDPPVAANMTNARLAFALANSNFSTSNNQYFIVNEGSQPGSGLGVTLGRFDGINGKVVATQFRDSSFGTSGSAGNLFGNVPGSVIGANSQRLVVGKITWGPTSDTIQLYEPDTDLNLGAVTSTLTANVNQSAFDAITWCRGDTVTMDEIRFGPTFHSVLLGSVPMTVDTSPPTPNPVAFHSPPAPSGRSSITMVAATAYDPVGVEYLFTCTSGGGHSSGWQDSATYTDTGLTPGVTYSYTVTARDKSPARNAAAPSAAASTVIPTQTTVPDVVLMPEETAVSIISGVGLVVGNVTRSYQPSVPVGQVISQNPAGNATAAVGSAVDLVVSSEMDTAAPNPNPMTWASVPAAVSETSINMTATTASDPSGVEYHFTNVTVPDGSHDSGWQDSPVFTDTGLNPGTSYTYEVRARDKSSGANTTSPSATASAVTLFADVSPPVPNPMTFAVPPHATGMTSIAMTAATASDPKGVEYYFTCTAGGGHDSGWQDSPVYQDNSLTPGGSYGYTVMARDKSPNLNATAPSPVGMAVTDPLNVSAHAAADIAVSGTVTGTYANTHASDNIYQDLEETESGGNPNNRYSYLEHKWSFNVVAGGTVTFHVEAHHTSNTENDHFTFAYSTSGVNGPWQNMLTVVKTSDDNTTQTFVMPSGTTGAVHVRVIDTDRTIGNRFKDKLSIDRMFFQSVAGPAATTVPNVTGLAQASAESAIIAANLTVGGITTQSDAEVPAGHVISQNPGGTTSAAVGSSVNLVVSLGPAMTTVPNVTGFAQEAAESAIIAANLMVGSVTMQNDMSVPVGNVISQNPTGNTNIEEGSSVNLVVSLGPVMTTVPTVTGLAQAVAEADITAANLMVGEVTTQHDDEVPAGHVISQNPGGATSAAVGSAVNLMVSLGPDFAGDYAVWSAAYESVDLTDPAADHDGDGLKNQEERLWGLDPTNASSFNPIRTLLDATNGTFTYTRRNPALTGYAYTVLTSENLVAWHEDAGAQQAPGTPDADGVQTVAVTLSPEARAGGGRLFVRVRALKAP
jgi:beta-lactam-binding protein with PASTA domain